MDTKRQVTVVDLAHDGPAAVEERRRKAEAAAARKLEDLQRHAEAQKLVMSPPAATSVKTELAMAIVNEQSDGYAEALEKGSDADSTPAAANKQYFCETLTQNGVNQHSALEEKQAEREAVAVTSSLKVASSKGEELAASQKYILPSQSREKRDEHPPSRDIATKDEHRLPAGGSAPDVPRIEIPQKNAQQLAKQKAIRLEYTATPEAATEVTGNFFFDEFNRFMDGWLVPEEISSRSKSPGGRAAAGDVSGRFPQDAKEEHISFSHAPRQIPTVKPGCDWRSGFLLCCGRGSTRSATVCPLCNRGVGGIDEFRGPSLSRRWTRWVFRQCEEPLDMEAEFLVTPRARLLSPRGRESCNYQPVSSSYQTPILGVIQ